MNAETILTIARAEVGVEESPANSNNVKYNTAYYGGKVSGSKFPWCCAFIWWVFQQAGASTLFFNGQKTAYCPTLMDDFRKKSRFFTSGFKPGDIVFFGKTKNGTATHVGIIEDVNADGTVTTIEGNTSVTSDDNGGAVMRRVRGNGSLQIIGVGRPAYLEEVYVSSDKTVSNMLKDGVITAENARNWEMFLAGAATCKPEYIRTIFDRYHAKMK